jgi:hypothetical protein
MFINPSIWMMAAVDDKKTQKNDALTMALMVVTENWVCYHNGNSDR